MKRVFIAVTTILIAAICVLFGFSLFRKQVTVERGREAVAESEEWTTAFSHYINHKGLAITIDDKVQNTTIVKQSYMSDDMALMMSQDAVRDAFNCSVGFYDSQRVVIAKGEITIETRINDHYMTVRNVRESGKQSTVGLDHACVLKDETLYIPAEVLVRGIGYSYTWDGAQRKVAMASNDPNVDSIPYYYNYEDTGRMTVIKNQGDLGACWAFAAVAALESTLMPEEFWDFSEDHMIYNNDYELSDDVQGDFLMAVSYLLSWTGPVREEDDPYNDGMTNRWLEPVKHVQEIQFLQSKDYAGIKEMVFKYGAVESSVYIGVGDNMHVDPAYYNPQTFAYCYTGSEQANHEIVIIGWDDDFPASNFRTKVAGNGAFICKNSWGSEFGDEGIFYVSYYDTVIGQKSEVYTRVGDVDNYDHIYQYDPAGWVGSMGYERNKAYMANVYTAQRNETIAAVGFYATGEDTSYKVYVCSNYVDESSLNVRTTPLVEGILENAGYYTIDLPKGVPVAAGTTFAVIVEIDTPGSSRPVAVEIDAGDERTKGISVSGRSYISSFGDHWECTQVNSDCAICLKVYTND